VVVFGGLRLSATATAASTQAADELARAISTWEGPGVVVAAGDLFDLRAPCGDGAAGPSGCGPTGGCRGEHEAVAGALAAHEPLAAALRAFASAADRWVVVLPGERDAWLGRCYVAGEVLARSLGAELAGALVVQMGTRSGTRRFRVEPGGSPLRQSRPSAARPGARHLADVVPGVWRGSTSRWLSGADQLDDPSALARFVASRLVYRQLGRRLWLLVLPVVVVVVALRLHLSPLRPARGLEGALEAGAAAAGLLELALLLGIGLVFLRQVWGALPGQAGAARDLNEDARARSRDLVRLGWAGLVTGGTDRAELCTLRVAALRGPLQAGFYANPGCCSEVVTEVPPAFGGLGLPAPFLAKRQVGWVEVEGGNDLHARLLHCEVALAGATLAERLLARRAGLSTGQLAGGRRSARRSRPHPELVASFPLGPSWPPTPLRSAPHRRARRVAALVVAAAGFFSLVVALSAPLAHRLRLVRQFVPLVVPQAAGALAALAGVGLLALARGIRRGQRRAYVVCQVTLLAAGALDLVRASSAATSAVSFAVAAFLWFNRASFRAASDLPAARPLGRGVGTLAGVAAASILAGALALEASSWYSTDLRHHRPGRITWGQAFLATVERMAGARHVPLPDRLDDFFSPAMFAVTAGIALAAVWVAFRPVVSRSHGGRGLERAREVVRRYGAGTLDYFALRSDKQFFFSGGTVVAYAVYSGTCLVSPDPVGPPAERERAWRAFREFVDANGWVLAVLGAAEEWLPVYRATGMHDLYVGDEAVVKVNRFRLEGGRAKGLRQAVNRVARYGYAVSFHDPARVAPELAAELREVMARSRRGGAERGFSMTLGRIFDPSDGGLLLAVVRGPGDDGAPGGGRAVAFCQYVPAPAIAGYSLDLMRRDNGPHPNGLIDFAVVETIKYLKEHGYEGLGLNFATMRAVLAGEAGEGLPKRAQAWLLRRMSGSMQIESLWRFNAKFDPEWLPRYVAYDSPEDALPAALAIARAESFWELPVIGRFLAPSSRRG